MTKNRLFKKQKHVSMYALIIIFAFVMNSLNGISQSFLHQGNLERVIGSGNIDIGRESAPQFADLDGDDDLDLYVGNYDGRVRVFINDGSGNFSDAGYLKEADGTYVDGTEYAAFAFADIDEDNDEDMYMGGNTGMIKIYTNDGEGNLTFTGYVQASGSNIDVGEKSAPAFADIDGDHDLDLYIGEYEGYILIYYNDGSGNFITGGYFQADGAAVDAGSFAVPAFADIDGDNDVDMYVGNNGGTFRVYTNDGSGNFSYTGNFQADGSNVDVGSYSRATFADVDGDDDLDAYIGDFDGYINVYMNDGTGVFAAGTYMQADNISVEIDAGDDSAPAFADLDGDNDLDLYIGTYAGTIQIYINDGSGNFTLSGNLTAGGSTIDVGNYASPVFADVDKDLDMDLYVGNQDGNIREYKNDGSGNLSFTGLMIAGGSTIDVGDFCSPAFADIDDDGDLDIYTANSDGSIRVYTNNGSGIFDAAVSVPATGSSLTFADLDGDGDTDLYTSNGNIREYKNDGSGNLTYTGNLTVDGTDLYSRVEPEFADIDGNCIPSLFLGHPYGRLPYFTGSDATAPVITSTHNDQIIGDGTYCEEILPDYTGDVIATDNCDIDLKVKQTPVAGTTISGVNNTVTLTVSDDSGNFSEVSFFVDVEDNESPLFVSTPEIDNIDADENCEAVLPDYTSLFSVSDNCDNEVDITQNPEPGTIIPGGITSIIFTATDDSGNINEIGFDVEVVDNTNPVITSIHEDQTLDAGENCQAILPDYTGDITATDNCDSNLEVFQVPEPGIPIATETNIITLTVSDDVGNYDEITFNVAVVDNTAPVITSTHNDQTISANENCEASLPDYTGDVTATDNCSSGIYVSQHPAPETMLTGSTNTVTLTVTDDSGNYDEISFNVAVEDNTDPVITSTHNDQTIDAGENCDASLPDYTGDVTASDNCDETLEITQNPIAGTVISGETNTVTLTVTDDSGNYAEVSFNLTVEDNTNPTVTCIENQTVDADNTHFYTVNGTEFDPVETDDNCGVAGIINDFNNGSSLDGAQIPEGINTIVWTVTDDSGNENTCSFDVTVSTYVGIESLSQNNVSIHPNPTGGILNITIPYKNIKKLSITDITGKQIFEKAPVQMNETLDLSAYESGIYLIVIQSDKDILTTKVVKK